MCCHSNKLCLFLCIDLCLCVDAGRAEEVDVILQHSEGGVDSALLYAKTISKYMKDLMSYVEKRTSLGEWEIAQSVISVGHSVDIV